MDVVITETGLWLNRSMIYGSQDATAERTTYSADTVFRILYLLLPAPYYYSRVCTRPGAPPRQQVSADDVRTSTVTCWCRYVAWHGRARGRRRLQWLSSGRTDSPRRRPWSYPRAQCCLWRRRRTVGMLWVTRPHTAGDWTHTTVAIGLKGHSRSLKVVPFDRACIVSY